MFTYIYTKLDGGYSNLDRNKIKVKENFGKKKNTVIDDSRVSWTLKLNLVNQFIRVSELEYIDRLYQCNGFPCCLVSEDGNNGDSHKFP